MPAVLVTAAGRMARLRLDLSGTEWRLSPAAQAEIARILLGASEPPRDFQTRRRFASGTRQVRLAAVEAGVGSAHCWAGAIHALRVHLVASRVAAVASADIGLPVHVTQEPVEVPA